jgi:arylsulfatase
LYTDPRGDDDRKVRRPDREPGRGLPYGGIENLRPETKALVQSMAAWVKPMSK